MISKSFRAKFGNICACGCGNSFEAGEMIRMIGPGKAIFQNHSPLLAPDDPEARIADRERAHANSEYAKGVTDGERYQNDKKIYGQALADSFAFQDEMNRYNRGEDDY
jgi:hypothetical protein